MCASEGSTSRHRVTATGGRAEAAAASVSVVDGVPRPADQTASPRVHMRAQWTAGALRRGSRQEGDTLSWQLQPLQSPGKSPSGPVGCGIAGHQHQDPSSVDCFQLYNMPVSDTWTGEETAHELGNILSRIAERVRH